MDGEPSKHSSQFKVPDRIEHGHNCTENEFENESALKQSDHMMITTPKKECNRFQSTDSINCSNSGIQDCFIDSSRRQKHDSRPCQHTSKPKFDINRFAQQQSEQTQSDSTSQHQLNVEHVPKNNCSIDSKLDATNVHPSDYTCGVLHNKRSTTSMSNISASPNKVSSLPRFRIRLPFTNVSNRFVHDVRDGKHVVKMSTSKFSSTDVKLFNADYNENSNGNSTQVEYQIHTQQSLLVVLSLILNFN
jgi:hypothetical protein